MRTTTATIVFCWHCFVNILLILYYIFTIIGLQGVLNVLLDPPSHFSQSEKIKLYYYYYYYLYYCNINIYLIVYLILGLIII